MLLRQRCRGMGDGARGSNGNHSRRGRFIGKTNSRDPPVTVPATDDDTGNNENTGHRRIGRKSERPKCDESGSWNIERVCDGRGVGNGPPGGSRIRNSIQPRELERQRVPEAHHARSLTPPQKRIRCGEEGEQVG